MKQENRTISTLLMPMQQIPLLLPSACVAEITEYHPQYSESDNKDWCLGEIYWRGLSLPLIAFERLNRCAYYTPSTRTIIAVISTTNKPSKWPFYALLIQGLPKTLELTPADIEPSSAEAGYVEKMKVIVNQIPSCIPDLDAVEKHLNSVELPHPPTGIETV